MKTLKIFYALVMGICFLVVASCHKQEDDFFYKEKIIYIPIAGYNGSSEELEVIVDSKKVDKTFKSNEIIAANYLYSPTQEQTKIKVAVREKSTGKIIIETELDRKDTTDVITINYFDGQLIKSNPPSADPNTNKVGLYIINRDNNDLADLVIYDDNLDLLTIVGKNIPPNQWVYLNADFITTKGSEYQLPVFFKSGTPYAEEDGYFHKNMWVSYISGNLFFPTDGTKGQVRSFVITNFADSSFAIPIQ